MTRAVAVSWRRLAEPAQTVVPNATAKDHSCGVNLLSSIYRQRPPRCQQDLNDKQHDTHPNPDTTFPFHAVRAKRRPLPSRPGDGRRHRRSLAPRSVNGLPNGRRTRATSESSTGGRHPGFETRRQRPGSLAHHRDGLSATLGRAFVSETVSETHFGAGGYRPTQEFDPTHLRPCDNPTN